MSPIRDEWRTDDGSVRLLLGDCLEILPTLADGSVDAVVTDPPYGLSFMGKRWDYDVPSAEVWAECLRVLKPGGHLLCFAGTRTQHRMAVRIEDAGFEIRDMIAWVYGSGFPKSLDVSKAIDKAGGASPRKQSEMLLQKRLAAGLTREQIAERIGCTLSSVRDWEEGRARAVGAAVEFIVPSQGYREKLADLLGYSSDERRLIGATSDRRGDGTGYGLGHSGELRAGGNSDAAREWQGWGTALKPAMEPITVARKPLTGTVAENVLTHGTGAINVDGCRVESNGDHMVKGVVTKRTTITGDERTGAALGMYGAGASFTPTNSPLGRWPANLIHDGSDEVVGLFPTTGVSAGGRSGNAAAYSGGFKQEHYGDSKPGFGDSGSAARFFYCAKASKADRDEGCEGMEERTKRILNGGIRSADHPETASGGGDRLSRNHHPTVKPTDLMRYLCRLVTPPGGVVLDPFAGSGSTGKGAVLEGFRFVGIEREAEYFEIAKARIAAKQKQLPLFAQTSFLEPVEATP